MEVNLKQIFGPWDAGWVLDKHKIRSVFTGNNEYGHPTFDTLRTEAGEATFQLKYRSDWGQAVPLAEAIVAHIVPRLGPIGFVIPMPASKPRVRQPVTEVATAVANLLGVPLVTNILAKAPGAGALKDLDDKEEKLLALQNRIRVFDTIAQEGRWNVLLIDDLYHTGATMEVACAALATYPKIGNIYVAALTWKQK